MSDAGVETEVPQWVIEMEAARARERRELAMQMGFSAVFHLSLLIVLFVFVYTPQGASEGLVEISMADVPALGDPDADLTDGVPSETDQSPEALAEDTTQDPSSDEQLDRIDKAIDDIKKQQEQELKDQQRKSAAAANADEARRVKGIRSADAVVGGGLTGRAGIGKLEPRTFYGMKVHSRRMVFVLDLSGSMDRPYAKLNLRNAYRTLGPKEKFAIVVYDNRVWYWPKGKRLTAATPENKAAADQWVNGTDGGGSTNINDALKVAFELSSNGDRADTFYFLSDGFATHGETDSNRILANVKRWNRGGRVIVHSIGLGQHDRFLMEQLAIRNRGKYRALRVR